MKRKPLENREFQFAYICFLLSLSVYKEIKSFKNILKSQIKYLFYKTTYLWFHIGFYNGTKFFYCKFVKFQMDKKSDVGSLLSEDHFCSLYLRSRTSGPFKVNQKWQFLGLWNFRFAERKWISVLNLNLETPDLKPQKTKCFQFSVNLFLSNCWFYHLVLYQHQ